MVARYQVRRIPSHLWVHALITSGMTNPQWRWVCRDANCPQQKPAHRYTRTWEGAIRAAEFHDLLYHRR